VRHKSRSSPGVPTTVYGRAEQVPCLFKHWHS
jgi:hypothetical protein